MRVHLFVILVNTAPDAGTFRSKPFRSLLDNRQPKPAAAPLPAHIKMSRQNGEVLDILFRLELIPHLQQNTLGPPRAKTSSGA